MGTTAMAPRRRLALAGAGMLAVLAFLPAAPAALAGAADLLAAARTRGTLRVAMEGSYPPFNFIDAKTGQMSGYDADVARLLAARLGLQAELVSVEWTDIFSGLAAGKYDVIVSQAIITPRRQQVVDFSEPYTYSRAQVLLRKNDDATYSALADLKGKTIGVARDSFYEAQARAVPGITVRSYPAAPETLQDLAFGRIDAALNDSLLVTYLVNTTTLPIRPGPLVGAETRIGVAFQKGNPAFKAALDAALGRTQADGTLANLSRKWFRLDASRPAEPQRP
jgi:cystine transport system substrate-binding protein